LKIQKKFDNNIVELSTISDEGVKRLNINEPKACHHKNPTNVIITTITIDTRPNGKIINRHIKKIKPNFPPNLHTKPNNLPWTNPEPRKEFNEDDIEWIEEEYSKSGIPRMSKNKRSRKFSYKGEKKKIVPLCPKNYANEKGSHKNRKVGLEPRLACVKEMTHDMFNMPMNESHIVWPLN